MSTTNNSPKTLQHMSDIMSPSRHPACLIILNCRLAPLLVPIFRCLLWLLYVSLYSSHALLARIICFFPSPLLRKVIGHVSLFWYAIRCYLSPRPYILYNRCRHDKLRPLLYLHPLNIWILVIVDGFRSRCWYRFGCLIPTFIHRSR